MGVIEKELEELLKRHHWTISRSKTGNQQAFSARQGPAKRRTTRYIATEQKLEGMNEADVLLRLGQDAPDQQHSTHN